MPNVNQKTIFAIERDLVLCNSIADMIEKYELTVSKLIQEGKY